MRAAVTILCGYLFGLSANCALAVEPGQRVDNFRLLDHTGASHELYYLSDMKAVAIMVHGNGCRRTRLSRSLE